MIGDLSGSRKVIRADWGWVEELLDAPGGKFKQQGSVGRGLQDQLLDSVRQGSFAGPQDWLKWLRSTRNALVHRGATTKFYLPKVDPRGRAIGWVKPFVTQPQSSEMNLWVEELAQAKVASAGGRKVKAGALLGRIMSDPASVLEGLIGSTSDLLAILVSTLGDVRKRRIQDSSVLGVSLSSWDFPRDTKNDVRFEGYGSSLTLNVGTDTLAMGGQLEQRIRVASLLDSDIDRWI